MCLLLGILNNLFWLLVWVFNILLTKIILVQQQQQQKTSEKESLDFKNFIYFYLVKKK